MGILTKDDPLRGTSPATCRLVVRTDRGKEREREGMGSINRSNHFINEGPVPSSLQEEYLQ